MAAALSDPIPLSQWPRPLLLIFTRHPVSSLPSALCPLGWLFKASPAPGSVDGFSIR